MKEMMEQIYNHKMSNDSRICFSLTELIDALKFESIDALRDYEDKLCTIGSTGERLSEEKMIDKLYNSFVSDHSHYETVSVENETKIMSLYEEFSKASNNEEKIIILLKIYSLLDWGIPLPYTAYNLILEDKLI